MSLGVGARLGHYQVTAKLGEGGMGEVWRATDTQLNRDVALKILPEAFATDPDRLARFQREAQVLASLNHPNIAQIHGIEEDDDTRALVLELVEGPTLAERISQGPIPVDEALPIAKQIAEALEAAHEAGVIHRDLKPANIKVKDDGTVKVLDFGLAKALDPNPTGDPSQSPTLTAAATQMGVIMGTAAYMSPEQARGEAVDKRSDIWAFGCVAYEMLTGRRSFEGHTVSDTLASVLAREPDLDGLPANIPPPVRRLLRRCLEKDPRRRLRDIAEGFLQLDEALAESTGGVAVVSEPAAVSSGRRDAIPMVVAALVLGGLVTGGVAWILMQPEALEPRPPVRFTIAAPVTESFNIALDSADVAISPDGHRVAYLTGVSGDIFGDKQLLLRTLSDFTPTTLAGGAPIYNPFFSPDGEWVGFYDLNASELRRVSVQGGSALPISDLDAPMRGASWGDDDTIVFATQTPESGLWRVAASGGVPEQLTTPDEAQGELDHVWPEFLPGSRAVLFTIRASLIEDSLIAVLSLDTGEQRVVVRGGSQPRYAATGHIVYGVGNTLRAVPFDLERLETIGAPIAVVEDVVTKTLGAASFGLSRSGSLVFVPGTQENTEGRTLVWVDRDGREEEIPAPTAPYESPRLSPDGRYVALEVRDPENEDVMVYDLQRETPTRLTFDPARDGYPLWSPDGQRVLFSSAREGPSNIYSKAADGTGGVERVTTSDGNQTPLSWSADGQSLVIYDFSNGQGDLALVSFGAENETEGLIETQGADIHGEVSPDGRWMAYASNESGQFEVYVRPFPDVDDGRWQISRDGGTSPVWAPDGQELFFRAAAAGSDVMVVAVETEPTFSPGNPEILFSAPYRISGPGRGRPWDVAADGRFLMVRESAAGQNTEATPRIVMVQNWFQELSERVPVN